MTKRFSVSVSDWVYDRYFSNVNINRSRFIEEMIVKGSEVDSGEIDTQKKQLIKTQKTIRTYEDQINKLKVKIGRLENRNIKPNFINYLTKQCNNCSAMNREDGKNCTNCNHDLIFNK